MKKGRRWTGWQSPNIGWFADHAEWENIRSVGVSDAVRGHWSAENNLHWSLDVIFGQDHRHAAPDSNYLASVVKV